jgi:hypothetical protein
MNAAVGIAKGSTSFVAKLAVYAMRVGAERKSKAQLLLLMMGSSGLFLFLLLVFASFFFWIRQSVENRRTKKDPYGVKASLESGASDQVSRSAIAIIPAWGALGAAVVAQGISAASSALNYMIAFLPILMVALTTTAVTGSVFYFSDSVFQFAQQAEVGYIAPLRDSIGNLLGYLTTLFWLTTYYGWVVVARTTTALTRTPIQVVLINLVTIIPDLTRQAGFVASDLALALAFWLQNDPLATPIPLYTTFHDATVFIVMLYTHMTDLLKAAIYILDGAFLAMQEPSLALSLNAATNLPLTAVFSFVIRPIVTGTAPTVDQPNEFTEAALLNAARYVENATTYQFNRWIYGDDSTLIQYVNGSLPVPPDDDIIYLVRFLRARYIQIPALALQVIAGTAYQILYTAFNITTVFSYEGASVFTLDYIRPPALDLVTATGTLFDILPTCNTNPPTFTNISFGDILYVARALIWLVQAANDIVVGEFYDMVTPPFAVPGQFTATYLLSPTNALNAYIVELSRSANAIGCTIGLVQPALGNAVAGFLVVLLGNIPYLLLQTIAYVRYSLEDANNAYVFDTIDVDSLAVSLTRVGRIAEVFYQFEPGATPEVCRTRLSFFCMVGTGFSNLAAAIISGGAIGLKSILFLLRTTVLLFVGGLNIRQRVYNPDYRATVDLAYLATCQIAGALGKLVPIPLPCYEDTTDSNLCNVREYEMVFGQVDNCMATLLCKFGGYLAVPFNVYVILVMLVNSVNFQSSNLIVTAVKMMIDIVIFRILSPVCPLAHFFDCVLNAILRTNTGPVVSDFVCTITAILVYIYRILGNVLIGVVQLVLQVFLLIFAGGGADPARTLLDIILGFLEIIAVSIGQLLMALLNLVLYIFFGILVAMCYVISPFTLFFLLPKCKELQDSVASSLGAGFAAIVNDAANRNYKRAHGEDPPSCPTCDSAAEAKARATSDTPEKARAEGRPYRPFNRDVYNRAKSGTMNDEEQVSGYCALADAGAAIHSSFLTYFRKQRESSLNGFWKTWEALSLENKREDLREAATRRMDESARLERIRREARAAGVDDEDMYEDPNGVWSFISTARERMMGFAAEVPRVSYDNLHTMCPNSFTNTTHARRQFEEAAVDEDNYDHMASVMLRTFGPGPLEFGMTQEQLTKYFADYVWWEPGSTCNTLFQAARDMKWSEISLELKLRISECIEDKAKVAAMRHSTSFLNWLPEDILYNARTRVPVLAIQIVGYGRVLLQWGSDRSVPYGKLFDPEYQAGWNRSGLSIAHYAEWKQYYPGENAPPTDYLLLQAAIENWTLTKALKVNYPGVYGEGNATDPLLHSLEIMYTFGSNLIYDAFGVQYNDTLNTMSYNETGKYGAAYPVPPTVDFMNDTSLSDEYKQYMTRLYATRLHTVNLFSDVSMAVLGMVELMRVAYDISFANRADSILSNFKRSYEQFTSVPKVWGDRWPTVKNELYKAYGSMADELVSGAPIMQRKGEARKRTGPAAATKDGFHAAHTMQEILSGGAHTLLELTSEYFELQRNKTAPICIEYIAGAYGMTYEQVSALIDQNSTRAAEWRRECAHGTLNQAKDAIANTTLARIISGPGAFIRGIFGPRTPSAVIAQQRMYDAIVGAYTVSSDMVYIFTGEGRVADRARRILYEGRRPPDSWFSTPNITTATTISIGVSSFAANSTADATGPLVPTPRTNNNKLAGIMKRMSTYASTPIGTRTASKKRGTATMQDVNSDFMEYQNKMERLKKPAVVRTVDSERTINIKGKIKTIRTTRSTLDTRRETAGGIDPALLTALQRQQPLHIALETREVKEYCKRHGLLATAASLPPGTPAHIAEMHARLREDPNNLLGQTIFGATAATTEVGKDVADAMNGIAEVSLELGRVREDVATLQVLAWAAGVGSSAPAFSETAQRTTLHYRPLSRLFEEDDESPEVDETGMAIPQVRKLISITNTRSLRMSATAEDGYEIYDELSIVRASVDPIQFPWLRNMTCSINIPFLCEYFYIFTVSLDVILTSITDGVNYMVNWLPDPIGMLLPFLAYTLDSNAIVISGSGSNPPRVLSPTYPVGSYYRLWPEEIQNGVSLTKWFEAFVGPFPPYSVNGTLYQAVVQYRDEAEAARVADIPYSSNMFYELLIFIQFTLGIDIINLIDTLQGYVSGNINTFIANLYMSTLTCPASAYTGANQNYSFGAGIYVTFVWVGGFWAIVALFFTLIGGSLFYVLPLAGFTFLFAFPIITYRWSLWCILIPAPMIFDAFNFVTLSAFPKCNGIVGTFISSRDWNAATCNDPSATWEAVTCTSYFRNVFDVIAYLERWLNMPPVIGDWIRWIADFAGLQTSVSRDWSLIDMQDEVLYANLGGCSLLGAAALGSATAALAIPPLVLAITVLVASYSLIPTAALVLIYTALLAYDLIFQANLYVALAMQRDDEEEEEALKQRMEERQEQQQQHPVENPAGAVDPEGQFGLNQARANALFGGGGGGEVRHRRPRGPAAAFVNAYSQASAFANTLRAQFVQRYM